MGKCGDEALPFLVAESISPGAKDLLRTERVGYYDSGGSLFLPAHGAYLYIDRPPPKTSLLVVAPTSSGKTMIGELAAIQAVTAGKEGGVSAAVSGTGQ